MDVQISDAFNHYYLHFVLKTDTMQFDYTSTIPRSELSERLPYWIDLCDRTGPQRVTGYFKGPFSISQETKPSQETKSNTTEEDSSQETKPSQETTPAQETISFVQFDVSGKSPKLHLRYEMCLSAFQKVRDFLKAEEARKLSEQLKHHQEMCEKTSKLLAQVQQ